MWLDGLYMGTPFYAEYTHRYVTDPEAQAAAYDDILNQILLVAKHTYDPANGLYRHACDISRQMFWADPVTGQSKHCWGRALGWYAMAIVDDLEFIPAEQPRRDEAVAIFNNIAEQLKKYQDAETGLWYQVIDRSGDEGNYVESSCSAMFIYSLLKGVRLGLIDPSYLEVAQKGYQGYLKHFIEKGEDGLLNITQACAVAGLGGKENRSGDYEYYINEKIRANDPKAVGPFIMAILEMEKVEENR
jgi:glycoside hydrolase family 15